MFYTSPQDGTTLDTFIVSGIPTTNFSTYSTEETGNYGGNSSRSLLQFPGLNASNIPAGATILSATLYLKINADYSSNARTVRLFRSKRDVVISQCTWNVWKTGSSWSSPGAFNTNDCEQTDIGSFTMSASETVGTWKAVSLTPSAIKEIINGTWTTPTLLLKVDTESADRYDYYSTNDATSTNRPYIVVEYTLGGVSAVFLSDYGVM
jgi:hypothetical protein